MSALQDESRRALDEQVERAAQRYAQTEAQRRKVLAERRSGSGISDSIEQLEARAKRLVELAKTPPQALADVARADAPERMAAYERIIGASKDLQAASFLPRGERAAKCVGRISEVDGGRQMPLGTGFLVSERLLMTNNHVLPDLAAARRVVVEFGAEMDIDNVPSTPVRYLLDPDTFFVTDEHLDVSLALVQPDSAGNRAGQRFGWLPLIRQQGKIVIGESINVIGHPMGRLKEISIRNNTLDLQLDHFLHYSTDTEPGNSGSPVLNDDWEVVALHHAAVSNKDDQGNVLRKDGQLWRPGDGDDAIHWVGNEGARVSVIVGLLADLELDHPRRQILTELGPAAQASDTAPDGRGKGKGMSIQPKNLQPEDIVLEALPDDVVATMENRDRWMASLEYAEGALEFLVADLQTWTPGQNVRVAFLGGSAELHAKIEEATQQIVESANLTLDFRENGTYRTWTPNDTEYAAEIRVSFDREGYFSLVGTDSVDPNIGLPQEPVGGRAHQRSLNLSGFDVALPETWQGTVRHEFLHALAFHHEHQNMRGPCEAAFRWEDDPGYVATQDDRGAFVPDAAGRRPGIYTYLSGFPNGWSRAKVDHNLRTRETQAVTAGAFDAGSVMLYRFPPLFYRAQPSPCAPTGGGQALSDGDRRGLGLLYPRQAEALEAISARRHTLLTTIERAQANDQRDGLESLGGELPAAAAHAARSLRASLERLRGSTEPRSPSAR